MAGRDFYTLKEGADILGVTQRRLLERLETGEIQGERDPQSSRWKIPKHVVHELVPKPTPTDPAPKEVPIEGFLEQPTETVQELIEKLGNLQRELGRLRNRLELARGAENTAWQEEKELLLAELEREREGRRQEREQAENALRTEQDRLQEDQRRERERADKLQEENSELREQLETEKRDKGSWRRLLGG
jgi:DNA repair exonuclease SbcCD ATPase subunit